MKVFALVVMVVIVAAASEAHDAGAIIILETKIGNFLVNKAIAALQAKQNALRVKQNLILRQIPHLVAFKADKINSLLQLKKNLLSTAAAQLGQTYIISGEGQESPKEPLEEVIEPYSPPAAAPAPSQGPPSAAPEGPDSSYGPPPAAPDSSYGQPPAAPEAPDSSYGQPPAAPEAPDSSYGQPPAAPEAPASSYGPPPAGPVQLTPYVKPVAAPPSSTCGTCGQLTSRPVQYPTYRPGAHVQPAPPPRPQGIDGPLSRPQASYGPPAPPPPPPPQYYGLPANHKPASTYGFPARH